MQEMSHAPKVMFFHRKKYIVYKRKLKSERRTAGGVWGRQVPKK